VYATGGLGGLVVGGTVVLAGIMYGEVKLAERRIPLAKDQPPVSNDTIWAAAGVSRNRVPIRLAVLGDSTAAGYGVFRDRDTPAAQLAIGISEAARRPVHVRNYAVVGAETPDLLPQLTKVHGTRPELAIIMIGANDVTEGTKPAVAVPFLEDVVRALVHLGAEVVVGTCPDLGAIQPLPQPLRAYARRLSRKMAKEQTIAVVRAGGRTVSLGDLLGPTFLNNMEMFSADRFHPSAAGYAEAAAAILPSCLDVLGLRTHVRSASPFTTRRAKPVAKAAAQAVSRPGTEVEGTARFGRTEGRRGQFARLRRRLPRRHLLHRTRRGPRAAESAVAVPDSTTATPS